MFKDVITVRSRELLARVPNFRERWPNWFGHVEHSSVVFSQHVTYTLVEDACLGGGKGQDDMETTDNRRSQVRND